jgi:hypothetical protein
VSVVDRGEPETPCSEWHGDGTAGEDDRRATYWRPYELGRWVRPAHDDHLPRWQAAVESAELVQTLNQHQLVDENRLPGVPRRDRHGQAAVGDGTVPTGFKMVENRTPAPAWSR